MTRIRYDRTSRQRRRVGATLALAAASGGLLAAAMAGSPTARADDPFTDIANDVQTSIAAGQADYSAAGTDFSTAGGTNAGLVEEFAGFDNTFISPADYTLLGLTAAGTGTNFSGSESDFLIAPALFPITAAEGQADATSYLSAASAEFTAALTALSGGEYFAATYEDLVGGYYDVLAGQSETLAGLFSLGL
jgi:hypothetical protein